MQYSQPLLSGRLIKRYKRFLADVRLDDGREITLHCPNTGSMRNCLFPGNRVWYSLSDNPGRKYPGTWELAENDSGQLIGINTGRANALAKEAIENGWIAELSGYRSIQTEVKYGAENSRIDLLLRDADKTDCYVEVKSCTLLEGEQGFFPDAVSTRGQKHLRELMAMIHEGKRAVLFFVVQHQGISQVSSARHIDPKYAELLLEAMECGVEVIAYGCRMNTQSQILDIPLAFNTGIMPKAL